MSMSIFYNSTYIFHVLVSLLSRVEEAESEIERGKHSLDWYHIHVT